MAQDIARLSGLSLVTNLGAYLGVPLIHKSANSHTYNYVVSKVQDRLAAWKEHTLSMVGHINYRRRCSLLYLPILCKW